MTGLIKQTDGELIAKYLKGDRAAFDLLLSRYLKSVFNYLYRLVGEQSAAEDLTQETFIKIWKSLGRFDATRSFRAWILKIARRTAIDWFRKRKDLPFSAFDDESDSVENPLTATVADDKILPDELFEREETRLRLQSFLALLSLPHREIIFLRYQTDLTFAEIALTLGRPQDTVKSIHRRALIALRKIIDKDPKGSSGTAPK